MSKTQERQIAKAREACPHSWRRAANQPNDDPRAVGVCELAVGEDEDGQVIRCGAQFDSNQSLIEDV